jgi:hypothetical protein
MLQHTDVFLTPLKPSTKKSISAEAINASLYYLHVATYKDEIVKQSLEQERQSWEAEQDAPVPIARKPLPQTPFTNYPASQRPPLPPKAYPHLQLPAPGNVPDTQVARQAARSQHIRFNSASNGYGSAARKPVGPRPLPSSSQSVDTGLPHPKPLGRDAEYDELLAALDRDEGQSFDAVLGQTKADLEQGLHITLIRRDPSSSAQWNIGTLTYEKGGSNSHQNTFKIDIATPGYQKFAKKAGSVSFDELTYPPTMDPSTPSSNGSPVTPSQTTPFTREVGLTQPRPIVLQQSSYDRDDALSNDKQGLRLNTKASMRNQHFSFTSPWLGTCIFMTGMNGRSVKCRHTLPPSMSGEEGETITAAELRFNLPWSALKPKDANSHMGGRNLIGGGHGKSSSLSNIIGTDWKRGMQKIKEKRLSHDPRGVRRAYDSDPMSGGTPSSASTLSGAVRMEHESDSESDDDSHLDLRLGREKAGGGRKGTNAKLGKLIIEDEGLKMCDLVVAASMGVWWQYYARMDEVLH